MDRAEIGTPRARKQLSGNSIVPSASLVCFGCYDNPEHPGLFDKLLNALETKEAQVRRGSIPHPLREAESAPESSPLDRATWSCPPVRFAFDFTRQIAWSPIFTKSMAIREVPCERSAIGYLQQLASKVDGLCSQVCRYGQYCGERVIGNFD
jgi:hypothetical protein